MKEDPKAMAKTSSSSSSTLWVSFFTTRESTQRPAPLSNCPMSSCKIQTEGQNCTSSQKRSWTSPCSNPLCSHCTSTKTCLTFLVTLVILLTVWTIFHTRTRCSAAQHSTTPTCRSCTIYSSLMVSSVGSPWLRQICIASSKLVAWQPCRNLSTSIIFKA